MSYSNTVEGDALIYSIADGKEVELSYVILDGEDIYYEQDSKELKAAILEALQILAS